MSKMGALDFILGVSKSLEEFNRKNRSTFQILDSLSQNLHKEFSSTFAPLKNLIETSDYRPSAMKMVDAVSGSFQYYGRIIRDVEKGLSGYRSSLCLNVNLISKNFDRIFADVYKVLYPFMDPKIIEDYTLKEIEELVKEKDSILEAMPADKHAKIVSKVAEKVFSRYLEEAIDLDSHIAQSLIEEITKEKSKLILRDVRSQEEKEYIIWDVAQNVYSKYWEDRIDSLSKYINTCLTNNKIRYFKEVNKMHDFLSLNIIQEKLFCGISLIRKEEEIVKVLSNSCKLNIEVQELIDDISSTPFENETLQLFAQQYKKSDIIERIMSDYNIKKTAAYERLSFLEKIETKLRNKNLKPNG